MAGFKSNAIWTDADQAYESVVGIEPVYLT